MNKYLNRESNTISIASFYEDYILKKYDMNPSYQRLSVWSDEKQSFLIDSILKNFPIPAIFLHQKIDDVNGRVSYAVVDGKQRLLSIVRFIGNEIPVSSELEDGPFEDAELAGKYFSELDRTPLDEYKKRFWRYQISIEYVDTENLDIINSIFDRLNRNGEPLDGQELRNAKYHGTQLLNKVEEKCTMGFWNNRLEESTDKKRMEDREFISELFFVIINNGPIDSNNAIIDSMYQKFSDISDFSTIESKFDSITDFMESLNLDYERLKIKGVSHLYGIWCLCWYCVEKGMSATNIVGKLNTMFENLRSNPVIDSNAVDYKKSMSSRTKSISMRRLRFNSLLKSCGLS